MKKKNKKIDIKLINYCYILLQIHFIHYPFFVELLDNLKIHKFLINFNDIWFLVCILHDGTKYEKIIFHNIYIYIYIFP